MSNRLAVLVATAFLALGGGADAATVTFSDIDARWMNVEGGNGGSEITPPFSSTSTSVRWPEDGDDQSGYDFDVAPQPITVNLPPDPSPFVLGDFDHLNFPVPSGSGITGVQLRIRADLSIDQGSGPVDLGQHSFFFDFDHLETSNGGTTCPNGGPNNAGVNINGCADRVTFGANPASASFDIGGTLYTVNLLGFVDGGNNQLTEFWTVENSSNVATLVGNVERVVPNTPTNTPTNTSTNTPSHTPTATPTFTHTATRTFTPTNTPTSTPTFTHTATRTFTPSNTPTSTPTFTHTATNTFTPSNTPTSTPTFTHTATLTSTPSNTPTSTPTFTHTATETHTFTHTATATETPTETHTFTETPTTTHTFTPSSTPTETPTHTHTATETHTPTATETPEPTSTHTFTATATATEIPESCGNGAPDPGEACDDGNGFGGDGCEPGCTLSTACTYTHAGVPAVHYVNDTTANDGVGADPGCASAAFTSIQEAIDDGSVADGDVISVCPGTYAENVTVSKELLIVANGGAVATTVQATGVAFDVLRSGVTIADFAIEVSAGTAISADSICPLGSATCTAPGRGSNLTILGNRISGDDTGIAWQRKVDCALVQGNESSVTGAHIDIDQQEGAPAVLVQVVQNSLSGGGAGGAALHASGISVRILGNLVQDSATAGIVVANLTAGSRIEENNILNNTGDGITMLPGSAATRVTQNNIVDNGVGLGNEAGEGPVDATLNWWGSQSGPFHATKALVALGDTIVERNGGLNTLFIEFLCGPAPGGFPSVAGICNAGELSEEVLQIAPGREPDISSSGRYITFVSDHDLSGDIRVTADNADGGDEVFLINVKPLRRQQAFCLGGTNPGGTCESQRDCPADFNADPIVSEGVCVLITQLSNEGTGTGGSHRPQLTQNGNVVFATDADLFGTNGDGSLEVHGWNQRVFRRLSPPDPNQVVNMYSNGVGLDSSLPSPDRGGRRVVMQSAANPLGTNADGNIEIFLLDARDTIWTQITNTTGHDNTRPVTQSGRQLVFDSTADLVPGQNADGNREVFFGKFNKKGWRFTQITNTVGAENRASDLAKNGKLVLYTSNANPTGQNADGNREVFLAVKGTPTQITDTTVGENANPQINARGRFIVFESTSDVEATGAVLGNRRVHLFDLKFGTTLPISRSAFGDNFLPRISRGRFVVWQSTANLTGGNPGGESVIYLFNRRKDN